MAHGGKNGCCIVAVIAAAATATEACGSVMWRSGLTLFQVGLKLTV